MVNQYTVRRSELIILKTIWVKEIKIRIIIVFLKFVFEICDIFWKLLNKMDEKALPPSQRSTFQERFCTPSSRVCQRLFATHLSSIYSSPKSLFIIISIFAIRIVIFANENLGWIPLKRKQVMSQASIDSLLVARGLLPLQIPFLFVVFPLPPLFWFRY